MKKLPLLGTAVLLAVTLGMPALADMPSPPAGPIKLELTGKPVFYAHAVPTSQRCESCHSAAPRHFPPLATAAAQNCAVCHHMVDNAPPPSVYCSECHVEMLRTDKTV